MSKSQHLPKKRRSTLKYQWKDTLTYGAIYSERTFGVQSSFSHTRSHIVTAQRARNFHSLKIVESRANFMELLMHQSTVVDLRSVSFSFVSIVKTFHQKPSYFLFISRRQVRSVFHTSVLAHHRLYKLGMRIHSPHSVHLPSRGQTLLRAVHLFCTSRRATQCAT